MKASLNVIDDRVVEEIPRNWRNVGTEGRWLMSSLGAIKFKRRIYLDRKRDAGNWWMSCWE
ncbi:MAG: hypothetical protein AB9891_15425 [Anaerolineaceae bacterium]